MPTNLLHHGPQNRVKKSGKNMAAIKGPPLYAQDSGTQREKKHVLTVMLMLMRRTSACKTSAGRSHIVRWLTAFLGPNLTPFLGPNLDPKKGSRIRSHFQVFFDVFAWAPFWGLDLDLKMGSTIGEFGHGLQMLSPLICDAFRMSMTINTCFFFPLGPTVLRVQYCPA